jgi:glycine/D-amino acid oxidase-like deaminating enzyme
MQRRSYSFWETSEKIAPVSIKTAFPNKFSDVLIVGAGFCGSWLAYFLKKGNPALRISVVERDFIGFGASLRNAGFLSCGNLSEWWEDSQELTWEEMLATFLAGIQGMQIIRENFGHAVSAHRCGSIDFDPLTEEKQEFLCRLNESLNGYFPKPFFEMRDVQLAGQTLSRVFAPWDGEANPAILLSALHRKLEELGIQLCWKKEVRNLGKGEAVVASETEQKTVRYGHAFLCTNAFARRLNPQSQVVPARGQVIVTAPCQTQTTRALGYFRSGYDYFRFIGDRLLVGGGRLDFKEKENTDAVEVTQDVREYLTALARRIIGHSDFSIEAHWSGIMGMRNGKHASAEDLLKIPPIDSQTSELAGFGGWGVVLTPYIAKQSASSFLGVGI